MIKYLLLLLLFSAPVFGLNEFTADENIDERSELCSMAYYADSFLCDNFITRAIDSSNRFFSEDIEEGIANSNSVADTEKALLDKELSDTRERVVTGWGNILSVVYLVVEAVKILFFVIQLFVLVHIPYFYVKMLVFIKKLAVGMANKRSR